MPVYPGDLVAETSMNGGIRNSHSGTSFSPKNRQFVDGQPLDNFGAELLRLQLKKGPVEFRVTGTSMNPLISPHSFVVLESVDVESLKIGDVLCIEGTDGKLLIHRLHGRESGHCLTRGDGRARFDRIVPEQAIIGRVANTSIAHWPIKNKVYIWAVVKPLFYARKSLGRKFVERVYRGFLASVRLSRWLRLLIHLKPFSVRTVRPDWDSVLVSRLCGLEPDQISTAIDHPQRWHCLVLYSGERPVACTLCCFEQGHWSLEAFGHQDERVGILLFQCLIFRLFGLRGKKLFTLKKRAFRMDWSTEELSWLLDRGFVKNLDHIVLTCQ